jgi:23S rRNA (adenine2503-C2)-methyltransferase
MSFLQSLTREELAQELYPHVRVSRAHELSDETLEKKKRRKAKYHAKQIFQWAYQRNVLDYNEMTDLPLALRNFLEEQWPIFRLDVSTERQSLDGTYKFLWALEDRKTIESVIIPAALSRAEQSPEGWKYAGAPMTEEGRLDLSGEHWTRLTACISSQVGCAMGCKFCLTGIQGLDRHLKVHEIVAQIGELRKRAPITNIVFMGMGEPLHNLQAVIKACQIFLDETGFNFSKRKVTVSTSGIVPAIHELGEKTGVSLAISLNGSNDTQRTSVMPVNKRWDIKALLDACRAYPASDHRKITYEYVLMEGVNTELEDADRVANLLKGMPAKVNLIPFNEHPGAPYKRPDDRVIAKFQDRLISKGLVATVRTSKGRDILAACGQLRSLFGTARGTDRHNDAPQGLTGASSTPQSDSTSA